MTFPVMLTRNDWGRIIGHHSSTRLKISSRWQGEPRGTLNAMKVDSSRRGAPASLRACEPDDLHLKYLRGKSYAGNMSYAWHRCRRHRLSRRAELDLYKGHRQSDRTLLKWSAEGESHRATVIQTHSQTLVGFEMRLVECRLTADLEGSSK